MATTSQAKSHGLGSWIWKIVGNSVFSANLCHNSQADV